MNADDLKKILSDHAEWLAGRGGARANLRYADLRDADLCYAYLRGANLCDANLCDANLRGANLCDADLRDADLRGANLRGANLCDADLRGANLCGANLCDADLCDANLCDADLRGANLCDANLCDADRDAIFASRRIVPEGSFTAYKKLVGGVIATLEIPAGAGRVGGVIGRKCRAEYARVVALSAGSAGVSIYDRTVLYRVGEIVRPVGGWCADPLVECAAGIHFFISRREAEEFSL